ncbi:Ubiquitin fusion degradation protein 4 [Ascosphaera acerosa]|nr:Ubiquitin fusion degradation protein 4 [Ascosphaera acerosa]
MSLRHTTSHGHGHGRSSQNAKQQKSSSARNATKQPSANMKKDPASNASLPSRTNKRGPRRQKSDASMREAAADAMFARPDLDDEDYGVPDEMDLEDDHDVAEDLPQSGGAARSRISTRRRHRNRGDVGYDGEAGDDDDHDDEDQPRDDHDGDDPLDDEDDPAALAAFQGNFQELFGGAHGGLGGTPQSFRDTLRALTGYMSGTSSRRFRELLANLRRSNDSSAQLMALQDLSDLLLVSNEDTLVGQFSPDSFVPELVKLMQPNELTGEENPEIMLLACRSLANMMEALQGSVASVVYGNAVPVLCQKLLDIQFIDLAEQALDTLAKISVDFPASIVREGGLTACLTYLDFFPTSTQRTAVTTAANCCRNLTPDSFGVVKDVMPILLNVLVSSDQKVVEQGCTCISRIAESFKRRPEQLSELIQPPLLRSLLRLLVPGTTNFIGPHMHTQLLRVLAITAKSSPELSGELLKMGVVDTLFQILTGVAPPPDGDESAVDSSASAAPSSFATAGAAPTQKIGSVHILQALIHLPREQIFETLNVICELLPRTPDDAYWGTMYDGAHSKAYKLRAASTASATSQPLQDPLADSKIRSRVDVLDGLPAEVQRFAKILFPTLTDIYSSTVNQAVREKVLLAQMKMLLYLDPQVLSAALCNMSYASFLAAIFTQAQSMFAGSPDSSAAASTSTTGAVVGDAPSLSHQLAISNLGFGVSASAYLIPVKYALQCAILLFRRLPGVYIDQFQREGVVAQIERIAEWEISPEGKKDGSDADATASREPDRDSDGGGDRAEKASDGSDNREDDEDDDMDSNDSDAANNDDLRDMVAAHHELYQRQVVAAARELLRLYRDGSSSQDRSHAARVLESLKALSRDLQDYYLAAGPEGKRSQSLPHVGKSRGVKLFKQLAQYFNEADKQQSITSAELLESGIVKALLDILGTRRGSATSSAGYTPSSTIDAQADFLSAFMQLSDGARTAGQPTAFSVLTRKLHDLLSRTECFEVLTTGGSFAPSQSVGGAEGSADSVYTRSSAIAMLGKQMRLRLVAEDAQHDESKGDDAESTLSLPKQFRNLVVSIHAIASFKALDDYLRPRIILSDKPWRPSPRAQTSEAGNAAASTPRFRLADSSDSAHHRRHHRRQGGRHHDRPHSQASGLLETPDDLAARRRSTRRQHQESPAAAPQEASTHDHDDDGNGAGPATDEQPDCVDAAARTDTDVRLQETAKADTGDEEDDSDGDDDDDDAEDEEDEDEDEDEGDFHEDDMLNALIDDLDADLSDEDGPTRDPSAVNVEVGDSGRVVAKREDGTKIATPRTTTPGTATPAAGPSRDTTGRPSAAGGSATMPQGSNASAQSLAGSIFGQRSFASYAAALASIPQDWHLEFKVNGNVVTSETTVFRAIHRAAQAAGKSDKHIFSEVHTVHYGRAPGPPAPEPTTLLEEVVQDERTEREKETGMARSLLQNHTVASILQLLRALHTINLQLSDIQAESSLAVRLEPEPLTHFINTKLTAKLNRQLEEPLIVASLCLPGWSEDLARQFPFLFPFETRHMFLRSTSFGYARALRRWQQAEDGRRGGRRDDSPMLGRLARQKVRISRTRILDSASKVLDMYGASPNILEIEYFEEVGTGLGPTLEFYSTVSRDFCAKKLQMWREDGTADASSEFVYSKCGLFPAPMTPDEAARQGAKGQLNRFRLLGKFVARSLLDSRIIDVPFSPTFFRLANEAAGQSAPTIGTMKSIDPTLATSLLYIKKFASAKAQIENDPTLTDDARAQALSSVAVDGTRIEELGLDFTLPGYPHIEMVPNGSVVPLTLDNVALYLERVVDLTLGSGVAAQLEAFRKGFSEVFPYSAMQCFTSDELVMLFGRVEEDWSLETLTDSMKADHGFNMDSRSVRNLLQVMSEFEPQQRRDFLQFITGSPKLPIGGFKSLTPVFTVVCRPPEPPYTPDDYLPSVMTCVNYLKLPDYSSIEVLAARLSTAMSEGQGAFHLS